MIINQMITGQSKWSSFLEANANTWVGFLVNLVASPIVYYTVGIHYLLWQLGVSTALFTIISIARGYVIRRWFNKKEEKKEVNLLKSVEYWQSVIRDLFEMNEGDKVQALNLIHDYKVELEASEEKNKDLLKTSREAINYAYRLRDAETAKLRVAEERISSLQYELELSKTAYQHFVADIVENTNYLEMYPSGESNKLKVEE